MSNALDKFRALELHRAGSRFDEIGADLNIGTAEAFLLVQEALGDDKQATVEQQRQLEVQRCDALTKSLWSKALNDTSKHLVHVDAVLKVMKRRADLLGLDKPKRHEVTGKDGAPIFSLDDLASAAATSAANAAEVDGDGSTEGGDPSD